MSIVEDEAAASRLIVVWDEGGECFKHRGRADLTYSPKIVEKKIEGYRNIVEGRKPEFVCNPTGK
ncbi:MAG TPA: hypothetical protein VNI60_10835 [Pyrinomonadaceae bacterium]|nr:hypothetical protein [Pyrinomonadaceae bacterium]